MKCKNVFPPKLEIGKIRTFTNHTNLKLLQSIAPLVGYLLGCHCRTPQHFLLTYHTLTTDTLLTHHQLNTPKTPDNSTSSSCIDYDTQLNYFQIEQVTLTKVWPLSETLSATTGTFIIINFCSFQFSVIFCVSVVV